jgi:hypothetical protein
MGSARVTRSQLRGKQLLKCGMQFMLIWRLTALVLFGVLFWAQALLLPLRARIAGAWRRHESPARIADRIAESARERPRKLRLRRLLEINRPNGMQKAFG